MTVATDMKLIALVILLLLEGFGVCRIIYKRHIFEKSLQGICGRKDCKRIRRYRHEEVQLRLLPYYFSDIIIFVMSMFMYYHQNLNEAIGIAFMGISLEYIIELVILLSTALTLKLRRKKYRILLTEHPSLFSVRYRTYLQKRAAFLKYSSNVLLIVFAIMLLMIIIFSSMLKW